MVRLSYYMFVFHIFSGKRKHGEEQHNSVEDCEEKPSQTNKESNVSATKETVSDNTPATLSDNPPDYAETCTPSDDDEPREAGTCTSVCCSVTANNPYQTTDEKVIEGTMKIRVTKKGGKRSKEHRVFQTSWYGSHKWLTLCTKRYKAFCFYCRWAVHSEQLTMNKNDDPAFTKTGFSNWKRATKRFKQHETCDAHQEATSKWAASKAVSVDCLLNVKAKADKDRHSRMMLVEMGSLRYLLRQGLALHGHDSMEGNLYQLLKERATEIPDLAHWLEERKYLSHEILRELISIMGNRVLREIAENVKDAKWYSILADETRDISNKEQLNVVLRWVSEDYTIHEDPVGMIQAPNTKSATLTEAILDVIQRCGLAIEICRGQAYDGASNMSGYRSGVARRIADINPAAIHVHCLAHCINLCLQNIGRKFEPVRDSLDLIMEIVQLIKLSPKCQNLFEEKKKESSTGQESEDDSDDESQSVEQKKSSNLRPLCPTRWTVRGYAIRAVLENYSVLQETLEQVNTTGHDEYSRRAGGQLAQMSKFSTLYGLHLSNLVFGASEQLSRTLQSKDTTLGEAVKAAELAKEFYEMNRTEEKFELFYENVVEDAEEKTSEPALPRSKRPPKKLDDGAPSHKFDSVKAYYKQQYIEVMESIKEELDRRFLQGNIDLAQELETYLIQAANGEKCVITGKMREVYSTDLDFENLQAQAALLPAAINLALPVKRVTNVRTICDALNKMPSYKKLLNQVDKLLLLYLTVPVTTSTNERVFSMLRAIKSYQRSTMLQTTLNNCVLLHIHKEKTANLNIREIGEEFRRANERRMSYFSSFL